MTSFERLQASRWRDPRCVCGKERFYSKEAAEVALKRMAARRLIQYGQLSEKEVYECRQTPGVFHLTSGTKDPVLKAAVTAKKEKQRAKKTARKKKRGLK